MRLILAVVLALTAAAAGPGLDEAQAKGSVPAGSSRVERQRASEGADEAAAARARKEAEAKVERAEANLRRATRSICSGC